MKIKYLSQIHKMGNNSTKSELADHKSLCDLLYNYIPSLPKEMTDIIADYTILNRWNRFQKRIPLDMGRTDYKIIDILPIGHASIGFVYYSENDQKLELVEHNFCVRKNGKQHRHNITSDSIRNKEIKYAWNHGPVIYNDNFINMYDTQGEIKDSREFDIPFDICCINDRIVLIYDDILYISDGPDKSFIELPYLPYLEFSSYVITSDKLYIIGTHSDHTLIQYIDLIECKQTEQVIDFQYLLNKNSEIVSVSPGGRYFAILMNNNRVEVWEGIGICSFCGAIDLKTSTNKNKIALVNTGILAIGKDDSVILYDPHLHKIMDDLIQPGIVDRVVVVPEMYIYVLSHINNKYYVQIYG